MALKDWKLKKNITRSDIFTWKKKKEYLIVSNVQNEYDVALTKSLDDYRNLKSFKIKSKAITYAKSYMRKH